jgi:hypothetical protein
MWIGKNSLPALGVSLQSGRVLHEFPRLFGRRPAGHILFLLSSAMFLAVTLVQKTPPVLIWDIDLTLARALPRNIGTADDPLKASDDKTPSTSGLIDLHASGSGEFTAEWRVNCKKNRQ